MIIDSHQHFWVYDPIRDSWIDDSMQIIRKDFLPEDLKPILASNHVHACLAVQADQSETETKFLLRCAEENEFVCGVIAWLDLCADDIEEKLQYYSKNIYCKGLRHIVQAEKDDFLLRKDVQNGINQIGKFDLTYDLLIYPKQIPAAIELVKKFPNQQFVLDHIAKPEVSRSPEKNWTQNIKALGAFENVSCKISGMVTEAKDYRWMSNDFSPFLDIVVKSFGIDRLMFGSDWPVCLLAAEYGEVLQIVKTYFESYSSDEISKIFSGNAIRTYDLKV